MNTLAVAGLMVLVAEGGVAPSYQRDIQPILTTYCYECHGEGSSRGDVALDAKRSDEERRQDRRLWTRVWENVRNGVMPPRGKPRPDAAARARLQTWIRRDVDGVDCRAPDPGRVTLRRLNRDEYNHTVADLFGIDFRPADDFPPDDSGYGFDNVADVLTVSPVLADKYFNAAEQIVRRVVAARPELPRRVVTRDDMKAVDEPAEKVTVREGRFTLEHEGKHAVDLTLSVNSFRPFTGQARVRVELDGRELLRATYVAGNRQYRRHHRLPLARGEHVVRFRLDLTDAVPDAGRAITIALEEVAVTGPLGSKVREYPAAHRRLFSGGPPPPRGPERQAYARDILRRVADQAFRRPVEPETLDGLLALAAAAEKQTGRFEAGIAHALQAILTSPRFLFRVEPPPAPGEGVSQMLDDHALAARLSYLLFASAPDGELQALAARGELRANLRAQVARLLRDPRSDRFVARFVGQWLQTRDVETVTVAGDRGRLMSPALRRLMRTETEMLFAHVMREDRDALELVTADYSFLNAPLARYYGLPGVEGPQMRKVALPAGGVRGGILTHASFLTVTSNPTRTSPVKRGLFVLDNLLGAPPPPPPPNVPNLEDAAKDGVRPKTVREQLAIHRSNAACAGCHARMDPLGLALEGFDSIGRSRDSDDGAPVDTRSTLAGGEVIAGVQGVRDMLVARREQVYRALTRKLMIFALGRGLVPADECTVDRLVEGMLARGGGLGGLISGIVDSPPFQLQRGNRS